MSSAPGSAAGFRHPDLMTWVRANRARLVAACLTLCQAWIAAGRPRGGSIIGCYENWAQVMGGVLEVAGIEGFLGNLEEMMEASDTEGAAWSAFVGAWWDRFGTAEVGTGDLYDLAATCEPASRLRARPSRPGASPSAGPSVRCATASSISGSVRCASRRPGSPTTPASGSLVVETEADGALTPVGESAGGPRASKGDSKKDIPRLNQLKTKAPGDVGDMRI